METPNVLEENQELNKNIEKNVIVKDFDASETSMKKINKLINDGVHVTFMGNMADFQKNQVNTMSIIKRLVECGKATYVPGSKDYSLYLKMYNMVDECKKVYTISTINHLRLRKMIMDKIEDSKINAPELYQVLCNIHDVGLDPNAFLASMQCLRWLGDQPIYTIKNDSKMRKVLISHTKNRIVNNEYDEKIVPTIKDLADLERKRIAAPAIGSQRKSAENRIKYLMESYLIDSKADSKTQVEKDDIEL